MVLPIIVVFSCNYSGQTKVSYFQGRRKFVVIVTPALSEVPD
jgi:hypothetical protein